MENASVENVVSPSTTTDANTQKVNAFAASIFEVMKEGQKVDKARNNVAGHLLEIARECADRAVFNQASRLSEALWRQKTKGLKLPKAFIQARSDIKRFFDENVSFYETKLEGENIVKTPRTYSEMGKAYRKAKVEADKVQEKVAESAKLPGLKAFEGITAFIVAAPGMQDNFLLECADTLRVLFTAWREEHPDPKEQEKEGEQEVELEQEAA